MKASPEEEHENHERWLVSYADFITLLFAFFVVMYATSNSDLEKQKKFEESVQTSFGNISKQPKAIAFSVEQKSTGNSVMELPNQINYNQDLIEIEDRLQQLVQKSQTVSDITKITNDGKTISLTIAQKTLFKSLDDRLDIQELKTIISIGQILKSLDVNFEILIKTNQNLDGYFFKRGRLLAEILINKLKIDSNQISLKFLIDPKTPVDSLDLGFSISN